MKSYGKALTIAATFILLAFPFLIWWKAQALVDWWALRNYTPPVAIASLASQDSMTDYSRHVFYVNHPDLTATVTRFRQECPDSEQTIVLGCYHSNQDGIDIYNVKDPRLEGIQQVTAAHEMLHAAYDRLSSKDRNQVNKMLQDFYGSGRLDQRVLDTIDSYRRLEPNDVVNEMHSIFGTEVANLPAPLENYYKQYFFDRSKLTNYAKGYEDEFTNRINQVNVFDTKLNTLKQQIESEEADLTRRKAKIDADRQNLESLRSSGKFDQYNASVPNYNAEADSYNALITKLKKDIATYNNLVEQRNSIAEELRSLDSAIDTRAIPEPVQ
jgi:hypothetical protein